jgi:hypothetical protein
MSDKNNIGCAFPIGAGSILAAILSAALNHSLWWGILHFFLGWFYIIYAVIFRTKEIWPALSKMFGGS